MKDEKKKQAASEEVKAEAKADSAKASNAGKTADEAEARDAAEFIKKLAETAEAVEQLTAKQMRQPSSIHDCRRILIITDAVPERNRPDYPLRLPVMC